MEASELKEILEQHKLWIETNKAEGKRANLRNANLEGACPCGADLRDADLYHANLTGADLRDANLYHANLWGADLRDANLYHANLHGANFTHANLTRAILYGANLEDADFTGADLTNANFTDADLTGAILTGADLTGAYLWRANLNGAILPDISWIIPGCLVQLNNIYHDFYLVKERNHDSFIQDSLGFFIQDNVEEKTFDILAGDRIIRNIPHWVKLSGMKQLALVSV